MTYPVSPGALAAAVSMPSFTERRKALRRLLTDQREGRTNTTAIRDALNAIGPDMALLDGSRIKTTFSAIRDRLSQDVLVALIASQISTLSGHLEERRWAVVTWEHTAITIRTDAHLTTERGREWGRPAALTSEYMEDLYSHLRTRWLPAALETAAIETAAREATIKSVTTTETTMTPAPALAAVNEFAKIVSVFDAMIASHTPADAAYDKIAEAYGPGRVAALKAFAATRDKTGGKIAPPPMPASLPPEATALSIKIDDAYLPALDKLFETATGGATGGIRGLLATADAAKAKVTEALKKAEDSALLAKQAHEKFEAESKAKAAAAAKVTELERSLAAREATATRHLWDYAALPAAGHAAVPAGKSVLRNAQDVFGIKDSRLDTEITCFEWDGPNTYVPEIDADHVLDPEHVATLAFAIQRNRYPWIKGHTGTGKTTLVEQYAARVGYMVMRINFDSEISRMDLIGRDVLKADGLGGTRSEFIEGILPRAMRLPCLLLCDEMDAIRSDIAYVFQRPLEGKGLLIAEDGGRLILPSPDFRIIATANTVGQGDEDGMYPAVRAQSQAMLDRFTSWLEVPYMPAEREVEVLMRRVKGLKKDVATKMVKFANEVRTAFMAGDCMQTISPRGLMAMGEKYLATGDMTLALTTAVLNKASKHDRATIKGLADSTF